MDLCMSNSHRNSLRLEELTSDVHSKLLHLLLLLDTHVVNASQVIHLTCASGIPLGILCETVFASSRLLNVLEISARNRQRASGLSSPLLSPPCRHQIRRDGFQMYSMDPLAVGRSCESRIDVGPDQCRSCRAELEMMSTPPHLGASIRPLYFHRQQATTRL
jgi:hypothetical protein